MRGKSWWICGESVVGNTTESAFRKTRQVLHIYFNFLQRSVHDRHYTVITATVSPSNFSARDASTNDAAVLQLERDAGLNTCGLSCRQRRWQA
jgi:hypothetical protein